MEFTLVLEVTVTKKNMWRQRLHIAFKTVVIFNWIVNIENKEKKYSIGKFNL